MSNEAFWRIIKTACPPDGEPSHRPDRLADTLRTVPTDDVVAFARTYEQHVARAYTWSLWGAAYVINGGCSDDGFDYFIDWLISEGRSTYEAALADPDSLATLPQIVEADLETLRYVPATVFEDRTGTPMPSWPPPGHPSLAEPYGEPLSLIHI